MITHHALSVVSWCVADKVMESIVEDALRFQPLVMVFIVIAVWWRLIGFGPAKALTLKIGIS